MKLIFTVTCPPLPEVPSGNLSITTDGSTTMAVYTCVNGYHLEGSAVIACTSDGIWNTSLPVCSMYLSLFHFNMVPYIVF